MKLAAVTSLFASFGGGGYVAAAPGHGVGMRIPAHDRFVLGNGVTLIILPRRDVPLIAFNAVLRGGALGDLTEKPGVSSLVAGLMEKGAGDRGALEFAEAVEGVGGSFGASASTESIAVAGQFLARDQDLMLSLLADVLMRPQFDVDEFDKLRSRQIELIKAAKDSDPSELLATYGRAFLFGAHPYGRPVIGSEASLASVTHRDVLDYYRAQVGADRLTLVFAGDVEPAKLKRAVSKAFGRWRKAAAPLAVLPEPAPLKGRRVLLIDSPGAVQTYFWTGNVGVNKRFPDRAALDLVNTLYGGRFTSILNTELRVKSGLTYGARAGFTRSSVAGEFSISSFTQTENTIKAIDLSLATLSRLHKDSVTPEMLESARAYVLGQYPLNFETAAHWAAIMGELELYGLGPEYINDYAPSLSSIGVAAARRVIDEAYPSVDNMAIVLIGDAAALRDEAKRYGPVTEMQITQPTFTVTPVAAATSTSTARPVKMAARAVR